MKKTITSPPLYVFCGLGLLVVAAVFSYWFARSYSVDVSQASYGRIQFGMTQTEVEKILGGPPGEYQLFGKTINVDTGVPSYVNSKWCGNGGLIYVAFDNNGKACWKYYTDWNNTIRLREKR